MPEIIGIATYASGEQQTFTDPVAFIKTVQEELPYRSTSGFAFKVLTEDAATRKAVEDLVCNEYGEENPHDLSYYQNTKKTPEPMTGQELNTALYQVMFAEQETYRNWLLEQPPEEILNHTYEYTVREDILMALENNNLTDVQVTALLQSPSPLADVFHDFEDLETGYMETVLDCMTERADMVLRREAEEKRQLLELPVYPYPAEYARENNELEQYRASHKVNVACKSAIESAIADNYRDNRLGREAVGQVVEKFGYDRTLYVLVNTVQLKDRDGRISHDNKNWARTIPIYEDKDAWGGDRRCAFVVDKSHPGLTDLFVTQARHDYLLTQPLTKDDIHDEAARLLGRLQELKEPNSPNGTHFTAQISPDFLARASSKDTEKLMALLPFRSMEFSGLNDRKGHFVIIPKEENRNQTLRKGRQSVRKKLEQASVEPKALTAQKKRGQER